MGKLFWLKMGAWILVLTFLIGVQMNNIAKSEEIERAETAEQTALIEKVNLQEGALDSLKQGDATILEQNTLLKKQIEDLAKEVKSLR